MPDSLVNFAREFPGAGWRSPDLILPGDAGPTIRRLFSLAAPGWPSPPTPLNGADNARAAQRKALDFFARRLRCLVALPPSAGKTYVGLKAGEYVGFPTGGEAVVVVCPAIARGVWRDQTPQWSAGARPLLLSGLSPEKFFARRVLFEGEKVHGRDAFFSATHLVLNYDIVAAWVETILTLRKVSLVIADEIHNIKTTKATRTVALFGSPLDAHRLSRVPYKLGLSGTPMLNEPRELYAPFDWLNPGWVGTTSKFSQRYQNADENQFGTKYTGLSATGQCELHERFGEIALWIPKEEALAGLPAKRRELVRVAVSSDEAKKPVKASALGLNTKGLRLEVALKGWGRALVAAGRLKVAHTIDFARGLCVASDSKIVVYTYSTESAERIGRAIQRPSPKARGFGTVYVVHAGRYPDGERRKDVADAFQSCRTSAGFVATMESVKESIDLSSADAAVFNDLSYVPGRILQLEDRVSRLGRPTGATIYYMLAEHTIDEVVAEYVLEKLRMLDAVQGKDAEKTDMRRTLEGDLSDDEILAQLGRKYAEWAESGGLDWDDDDLDAEDEIDADEEGDG